MSSPELRNPDPTDSQPGRCMPTLRSAFETSRSHAVMVVAAMTLLSAVLVPVTSDVKAAENETSASAMSAALLSLEGAITDRLRVAAADPATWALLEDVTDRSARRSASGTLEALRAEDGSLVRNACLVPTGRKGRLPVDGGLGDAKAAACIDREMRAVMTATESDDVQRKVSTVDGRQRLLLAAPMTQEGGALAGVLSVDVDLNALLESALPGGPAAVAMLVDLDSSRIVASTGGVIDPGASEHSLMASVTPLWPMADGGRLGLMELVPEPLTAPARVVPSAPPETPSSQPFGLGLLVGIVLLIVVLGMASYALGRSNRTLGSRARVRALYREAAIEPEHDELTQLPMRAGFESALEGRMASYLDEGVPFALAIVDVDDLRSVNDRDGLSAGDEVLATVARTLRQMKRPEDRLFRIADDEFALVMPGKDIESAVADLERALHFSRRPAPGDRPASFSGGVSGVPTFSTDKDIVLRQAEAALAWVKGHGRSAVESYDVDRDRVPDQPHEIANLAVREVVAGKLLSPVFQPIVDLRSGRVLGFEGLIRPDPGGPLPDTSHLFAAASASGRTVELDLACIEIVLAGARAIGPDRLLTVNLSPRTLEVRDFDASWLLNLLLSHGIAPGRVIVELTERDAVGDLPRLQQALRHLQSYGLRLAADDVGAGNAGLRLLSQVPFDIVKIDLSLVQDGVHRPGARAVLESLRDLAIGQNARIVAEGVETAEQLQVIQDLDIGAGQGYLLGRPGISVDATFVDLRQLAAGGVIVPSSEPIAGDGASTGNAGKLVTGGAAAMSSRPMRWGLSPQAVTRR